MTESHKILVDILTKILERGDASELKEILKAETLQTGLEGIKQKLGGPDIFETLRKKQAEESGVPYEPRPETGKPQPTSSNEVPIDQMGKDPNWVKPTRGAPRPPRPGGWMDPDAPTKGI